MYLCKNLVMILDGFFTSKHFLASRWPLAVTSAATGILKVRLSPGRFSADERKKEK